MNRETLNKLHQNLLEILEFTKNICNENNLQYYIAYGTALGAYRHKGFIPWDDDIDIVLPRKDYEKLKIILTNNDNKKYSIQDENSEDNYFLTFFKIKKTGTIFKEGYVDKEYKNNGIYIDVFPLEYVKDMNKWTFKLKAFIIKSLIHILRFRGCKKYYKHIKPYYIYLLDIIFSTLWLPNNRKTIEITKRLMTSNGNEEEFNYFAMHNGTSPVGWCITKDIYGKGKKIRFEGKEFLAPQKIEEYLKLNYGENFMDLPPENKRHTHDPIEISFGEE